MSHPDFVPTVRAFQTGDYAAAAQHAAAIAADNPADRFFQHASRYLEQVAAQGTHDMYASPAGFSAFVRGGGNVPLYQRLSDQLRAIYAQYSDLSLLEIGVGDGLALLPALTEGIGHVDLVEPSEAMLATTTAALRDRNIPHRSFNQSVETFITTHDRSYDIAQATFALHNLAPEVRATLFSWLRDHARMVLIAEFDVQMAFVPNSAEHIAFLVNRYRDGLAEYTENQSVVAQGFLMPILFRNFETAGEPTLHEQSLDTWKTELHAAGLTQVEATLIHPYWWSDAYLIRASAP